jgi:hypothetical protein
MKTNYKIYYPLLAGFLLFASCTDFLDKEPYGQFSTSQMDNSSIDGLMASAYAGLQGHFFGNNESFSGPVSNWVFDLRSDDAYKGGGGVTMEAYMTQLELGNVTSDNPIGLNKWRNNFFGIARVNQTIKAITALQPANLNELLGELRLIRGHFYFDLNRIFQKIPYVDENTDATKAKAGELTRDQIYDKIYDDFKFGYDNIAATQSQAGRFNKYAAAAYLSKLSIERKNYTEAITWADLVIGSAKYELYTNFLDMSKMDFNNKKEAVFAIQFSTDNNYAHINWGNLLNTTYSEGNLFGNGDDFYIGSQNLVNAFRTDANGLPFLDNFNSVRVESNYTGNLDPRLDFTLERTGFPFRGNVVTAAWSRDFATYGDHSNKKGMIDPTSADMVLGFPWGASALNFNYIRYAEVLLWKAEALIESNGDLDVARGLINQVRAKAKRSIDIFYSPRDIDVTKANYRVEEYPTDGWNKDYAIKALRMERRLELAMEGHRWFDLVRWGVATEVVNTYYSQEKGLRTWMESASLNADAIFLPVPISEVENSGGLYE